MWSIIWKMHSFLTLCRQVLKKKYIYMHIIEESWEQKDYGHENKLEIHGGRQNGGCHPAQMYSAHSLHVWCIGVSKVEDWSIEFLWIRICVLWHVSHRDIWAKKADNIILLHFSYLVIIIFFEQFSLKKKRSFSAENYFFKWKIFN